jgi:sugar/nucleoside kinase (ribokinase family)
MASKVPRSYYQTNFFYLSPAPLSFLNEVADHAHKSGARLIFVPKEDFPSIAKSRPMRRLLSKCFMCFLNEREQQLLTGETFENAISTLHSMGISIVVTTFGAKGAIISTPDNVWKILPRVISKKNDVVGAGDCFAAGILAGLSRGANLYDSSQFSVNFTSSWLASRDENEPEVLGMFTRKLHRLGSKAG